jgi:hypothetical protein
MLLILLAILIICISLLVGFGIGVGLLLHWLLPAIDLGMSVLIGVIAFAFAFQIVTRLMMSVPTNEVEDNDEGTGEMKASDVMYLVSGASSRKRRKRKGTR